MEKKVQVAEPTVRLVFPDGVEEVTGTGRALVPRIVELARQRGWRKVRVLYLEAEVSPFDIPAEADELRVVPYDAPGA